MQLFRKALVLTTFVSVGAAGVSYGALRTPGLVAGHAPAAITIEGTSFTPSELSVKLGEPVVWINKDPFPHNVTSTAGGFHSGDVGSDHRWQWRATKVGRFAYVCTLHPGMKGTLVVTQ